MAARGVASVIEALLVSITIVVLVSIAFAFFSSYLGSMNPTVRHTHVEAVLCGRVFAAKNLGQYPATIEKLVLVAFNQQGNLQVSEQYLNMVLAPGEKLELNLNTAYNYAYIVAGNFRSKPIPNDCAWVVASGGRGGWGILP